MDYAANLTVAPFESLLEQTLQWGGPPGLRPTPSSAFLGERKAGPVGALSPERRQLLALRLRKRAPAAAWFPGADAATDMRLFCFPHAGGGSGAFAGWRQRLPDVCP